MFTFQDLLTATGAAAASAMTLALVELLKVVIPKLFTYVNGAAVAFFITAVVYLIGAIVVAGSPPPDRTVDANFYLSFFLSWLACALATVGIKSVATYGLGGRNDVGPG